MLHIVNKSPTERSTLESCLAHALPGHSVLLIEDAVYAATRGSVASRHIRAAQGIKFYVLAPDLDARALAHTRMEEVEPVDYRGFVDLVTTHPRVQSWL